MPLAMSVAGLRAGSPEHEGTLETRVAQDIKLDGSVGLAMLSFRDRCP